MSLSHLEVIPASNNFNPFYYEPRLQKHKKKSKVLQRRKKAIRSSSLSPTPYAPVKCNLLLSILPESNQAAEQYAIFALKYIFPTFKKRFQEAVRAIKPVHLSPSSISQPDFLQGHRLAYIAAFIREYRLRWHFKCLYNRWRLSKFKTFNDVDPITLMEPNNPVYIYIPALKKKYVYDGHAILSHITAQLFTQIDGFAKPQSPKNPLTNAPFLTQHMRSIYLQLKTYNLVNWQLMLYYSNKFCMKRFIHTASIILTKHAIKNDVYNYTDEDALQMFKDYLYELVDESGYFSDIAKNILDELFLVQPNGDFLNFFRRLYVQEKWAEISDTPNRQEIVLQAKNYLSKNLCTSLNSVTCKFKVNITRNFGCYFVGQ